MEYVLTPLSPLCQHKPLKQTWMHVWLAQLMTCHSDLPAAGVQIHPLHLSKVHVQFMRVSKRGVYINASISSRCDIWVRSGACEIDLRMSSKSADTFRFPWQPLSLHRTFHLQKQLAESTQGMMERDGPKGRDLFFLYFDRMRNRYNYDT